MFQTKILVAREFGKGKCGEEKRGMGDRDDNYGKTVGRSLRTGCALAAIKTDILLRLLRECREFDRDRRTRQLDRERPNFAQSARQRRGHSNGRGFLLRHRQRNPDPIP